MSNNTTDVKISQVGDKTAEDKKGGAGSGGVGEGESPKTRSHNRVRRIRCKKCRTCIREDCGDCLYCRDMKKFGGPGNIKLTCCKRRCLKPLKPLSAAQKSSNASEIQYQNIFVKLL